MNECLNNLAMYRPLRPGKLLNGVIIEASEPTAPEVFLQEERRSQERQNWSSSLLS